MADGQKNEQDQNLRDILGFDPNPPADEPGTSTSGFKGERRGFPENWREIFKKSAKAANHHLSKDPFVDEANLFTISNWVHGISRNFGMYYPEEERFLFPSSLFLEDYPSRRLRFHTSSIDKITSATADFGGDKHSTEWSPIQISKDIGSNRSGGRSMEIHYAEDGNLIKIILRVIPFSPNGRYHNSYKSEVVYDYKGGVQSTGDFDVLTDEDRQSGILKVERVEQGDVKDEIEVPVKIDPQALKDKWIDPRLLENPQNPDPSLDLSWKGVDFFHDAGLRWDAVADDSFHSLTRLSAEEPPEL